MAIFYEIGIFNFSPLLSVHWFSAYPDDLSHTLPNPPTQILASTFQNSTSHKARTATISRLDA
jgi:hypothetical protein